MGKHILVVDDDDAVSDVLKSMLEEAGHSVSVASDKSGGMDIMRASKPDSVVLDYLLPGGNADELADYAQSVGVPVVMISGDPTVLEGEIGKSELARYQWLWKPFKLPQLLDAIDTALAPRPEKKFG